MADEVYYLNEYGDRVGYGEGVYMVTKSVVRNSPENPLTETLTVTLGSMNDGRDAYFFKNPDADRIRESGKRLLALADEMDRW